jgi:glycosyltransferase involved in cell wall biosynthesis
VLIYRSSIGDPDVTRVLEATSDPLVLVYHNVTPSQFFTRWDPRVERMLVWGRRELEILRPRVVAAIADSKFNARELRQIGYDDVTVLPVGINVDRLVQLPPCDLPWQGIDGTVVLAIGQLLPHKRIDLLLQAAYVLEHHIRANTTLCVVGAPRTPSYLAALHILIRRLSLNRVRLLGSIADPVLAELLRTAGVFVTASEHEGFCIPPLEAMGFGVPVLARPYGAVPETLGDAALYLDRDSGPVELAEGIVELISDRGTAQTLIRRGHERVGHFSSEAADLGFLEVIESVVG